MKTTLFHKKNTFEPPLLGKILTWGLTSIDRQYSLLAETNRLVFVAKRHDAWFRNARGFVSPFTPTPTHPHPDRPCYEKCPARGEDRDSMPLPMSLRPMWKSDQLLTPHSLRPFQTVNATSCCHVNSNSLRIPRHPRLEWLQRTRGKLTSVSRGDGG